MSEPLQLHDIVSCKGVFDTERFYYITVSPTRALHAVNCLSTQVIDVQQIGAENTSLFKDQSCYRMRWERPATAREIALLELGCPHLIKP